MAAVEKEHGRQPPNLGQSSIATLKAKLIAQKPVRRDPDANARTL